MAISSLNPQKGTLNNTLANIWSKKQIYIMLFPNVLIFASLGIYPLIWVLKYMFFKYDKVHDPIFIGLDNFVRIFSRDPYFWRTVENTFVYVGGKLLLTLPIALILAVILNKGFKGSSAVQVILFSPTVMSAAVMSMIFYLLLNPYSGDINRFLMSVGIIGEPVSWLGRKYAMMTVIFIGAWGAIGNYMVYFMAGLQSIPVEIYESVKLDGAGPLTKMTKITIPMMGPILKIIVMLSITSSFQDMQSIMVLTDGGPNGTTEVMFLYIYKYFFPVSTTSTVSSQYGYGAALSVVSAAIIGIVTILYLRFTRKLDEVY